MGQRNILAAQFDAATNLADGAAPVTAAGAATVGGVARVVNVGTGFLDATLIVDVDALKTSTGDEVYDIRLQGSTTADFSSDVVNLTTVSVGNPGTSGRSALAGVGRYAKRFLNSPNGAENQYAPPSGGYPYLRLYLAPTGTTPSITFRGFITKDSLQG